MLQKFEFVDGEQKTLALQGLEEDVMIALTTSQVKQAVILVLKLIFTIQTKQHLGTMPIVDESTVTFTPDSVSA